MKAALLVAALGLAACNFLEPQLIPTVTALPTLTGPTLAPSPDVRGEVPTLSADQVLGRNDPTAAAAPSGGDLPPLIMASPGVNAVAQPIAITLADGAVIDGELYTAGTERVPGVLMLTSDSSAWLDLPLRLQAAGFTILTLVPRDLTRTDDFPVLLRSLSDAGTVDPGSLAVIGADSAAGYALAGCAATLLCDAAALVSPADENTLIVALQAYAPRPLLVVVGDADAAAMSAASTLRSYAPNSVTVETGASAERGTALLRAAPGLTDALLAWLETQFP